MGKCCESPVLMQGGAWCSRCGWTAGQGIPNVKIKTTMYWNYEHLQHCVKTVIFECTQCEHKFRARMDDRIETACPCSNVQGRWTKEIIQIITQE